MEPFSQLPLFVNCEHRDAARSLNIRLEILTRNQSVNQL